MIKKFKQKPLGLVMVAVACAAFALPISGAAGDTIACNGPEDCPDLVVHQGLMNVGSIFNRTFSADDCSVTEGYAVAGDRRMLGFSTGTPNIGTGDLHVGDIDAFVAANPGLYTLDACHGHYHFKDYAVFRLWTVEGFALYNSLRQSLRQVNPTITSAEIISLNGLEGEVLAENSKLGFCFRDDFRLGTPGIVAAPAKYNCDFQGISRGWTDIYGNGLDGQWLDITDIPAGKYVLEHEVNPLFTVEELDYNNNSTAIFANINNPNNADAPIDPTGAP